MDKKLLDILCCPSSKQSLHLLSSQQLKRVNTAIADKQLRQMDGHVLDSALKEALVSQDQKLIYRIDDGIPVLLSEEAIASSQIADFAD